MGILLLPSPKKSPPLNVGSLLDRMTIVYDDRIDTKQSKDDLATDILPPAAQTALKIYKEGSSTNYTISSPDGYLYTFIPYSVYSKYSTSTVLSSD